MYITALIAELQIKMAQYGDIPVVTNDSQSFRLVLEIRDEVDPKTFQPIGKVVVLE